MGCDYVQIGGTVAIACSRGRGKTAKCIACSKRSTFQCDWKLGRVPEIRGGRQTLKVRTCDAHLCIDHAREVAPDKHVCPVHSVAFDNWKKGRSNA
jgi:hypothetical protein